MDEIPGGDAGSDESEIRGRNELADGRDEPVYSRPTFPSGTSNLNSSHQNGASSSSGRRCWVLRRWDTAPPVRAPCRRGVHGVYAVSPVHTGSHWSVVLPSACVPFVLAPPSPGRARPIDRHSSSFRKLLFFVPAVPILAESAIPPCPAARRKKHLVVNDGRPGSRGCKCQSYATIRFVDTFCCGRNW